MEKLTSYGGKYLPKQLNELTAETFSCLQAATTNLIFDMLVQKIN
jgi:hypothetical protein